MINNNINFQSYVENIICPNCQDVQIATVLESIPFPIYIHECTNCEYIIMESEWEECNEQN